MSYDVYVGGEDFNYTFNVSGLFYDHIPAERDRGGLYELNGLTGKQAAKVLGDAFHRIGNSLHRDCREGDVGDPIFCARYDAKNGWGSTVGAIVFLGNLLAACNRNPRCKVRLSA